MRMCLFLYLRYHYLHHWICPRLFITSDAFAFALICIVRFANVCDLPAVHFDPIIYSDYNRKKKEYVKANKREREPWNWNTCMERMNRMPKKKKNSNTNLTMTPGEMKEIGLSHRMTANPKMVGFY